MPAQLAEFADFATENCHVQNGPSMSLAKPFHDGAVMAQGSVPFAEVGNKLDLLRPDFGSPEAVQSFLLSAYRPAAGPKQQEFTAETACQSASSIHLRNNSLRLPVGLHRTDIPLVGLYDYVNITETTCSSLPAASTKFEAYDLHTRSDSAPARMTLNVSDVWANIPEKLCKNPFDQVQDKEGLFRSA